MALTNEDLHIISDLIDKKLNPMKKEIQQGLDRLEVIVTSIGKDADAAEEKSDSNDTEKQIAAKRLKLDTIHLLHRFRIPPNIKGYNYLQDAILLTMNEPEIIHSVTTRLYPIIAKKNASTKSRVERAIRHAIEVAWEKADDDVINEFFGTVMNEKRGKPANAEFIAIACEKLNMY